MVEREQIVHDLLQPLLVDLVLNDNQEVSDDFARHEAEEVGVAVAVTVAQLDQLLEDVNFVTYETVAQLHDLPANVALRVLLQVDVKDELEVGQELEQEALRPMLQRLYVMHLIVALVVLTPVVLLLA